jgi:hypothetical protein
VWVGGTGDETYVSLLTMWFKTPSRLTQTNETHFAFFSRFFF